MIVAAAMAVAALLFLLLPLVERWWKPSTDREPSTFAFGWVVQIVALAVAIAMAGMAFAPLVAIPASQWLGSIAIFLMFLCVLLVALSVLQSW